MWKESPLLQQLLQRRVAGLPIALIAAGAFGLFLVLIGLVLASRSEPLDINSPGIFSQVPTSPPLKVVTAQQVVDYLQGHIMPISNVKPYKNTALTSSDALSFNAQGQPAVLLAYSDVNALAHDSNLFEAPGAAVMPAVGKDAATIAAPTAKPTAVIAARWNADSLSNVLLLTDKGMDPKIRGALVSHLRTLLLAPAQPNYPTATP
jgi:hypothetical protein